MKSIAVIAKRGGVGKTTLSHALCYGADMSAVAAHFFHTDMREPLQVNERTYDYYDCRDFDCLKDQYAECNGYNGEIVVVDGAGNRPEFDKWAADNADLVLVPILLTGEDLRTTIPQLEVLEAHCKNVKLVVNRRPKNLSARKQAIYDQLPQDKILIELPESSATEAFLEDDLEPFITPQTKARRFSEDLYKAVAKEFI